MKKGKLDEMIPQRSEAGWYCESAEKLDPEPQEHQMMSPRKRARKGDTLNGEVHGISNRRSGEETKAWRSVLSAVQA